MRLKRQASEFAVATTALALAIWLLEQAAANASPITSARPPPTPSIAPALGASEEPKAPASGEPPVTPPASAAQERRAPPTRAAVQSTPQRAADSVSSATPRRVERDVLPNRAAATPTSEQPALAALTPVHSDAPLEQALPVASYTLQASLDAINHRVHGTGVIRLFNHSTRPLSELYFHLYLNAFKNSETLFQRSPFTAARSGDRSPTWGYIDVQKLVARELGGADLWPQADRTSPGDAKDETDIRVPLPQPLLPGSELHLEVEWTSQLPQVTDRTGYARDFHMVAQWFPKLARLEADGSFAHFPFHPHAEFYADYGNYEVSLEVPSDMRVGATGALVQESPLGERKRLDFKVDSVHDFAWSAWPGFQERNITVGQTRVRILYPAGYESLADRELDTVRLGLTHFGELYGSYPYPTLTVVHPPAFAPGAGGMEYPTLITTGGTLRGNYFTRAAEAVTAHELGHQWFYGLLASNEQKTPFLDEGLTSFAEAVFLGRLFGNASAAKIYDFELSADAYRRAAAAEYGQRQKVAAAAAEFADFSSLGAVVYARTATIMLTLSRVYGETAVLAALGSYARKFRFRHPTTADFVGEMGASLGAPAEALLRQLLLSRGSLDYRVARLSSQREQAPVGLFDEPGGRSERSPPTSNYATWLGEALIVREGNVSLPVDIQLLAADGSVTLQHWDGNGEWFKAAYRGPSELVAVVVDPELKILIDDNLLNNTMTDAASRGSRVSERLLYAAQLLLGSLLL